MALEEAREYLVSNGYDDQVQIFDVSTVMGTLYMEH